VFVGGVYLMMGLFLSEVVYLEEGCRKGKYLFDHRQYPCPLTDNTCAISVWLVATLTVHKLISDVCNSLAKFGLILCKAHVLPAAFQCLICFHTF
jgi:hypothetical protein